ncbi:MAG: hypothetical protein JL56_02120 [Desulfotomaculum sp. BICA1-6]|nr:MAG: hypothetical protein JL56_02120 [Desulfotomaculum sp. BICA1-6]
MSPNRLVVTQEYAVKSLDPALASDTGSLRVTANIYEGLVRFKPGTIQVEPCLARSWEVSEDAKVWTFNLRRNVLFHDGTPLDARWVESSIKRQTASKNNQTSYADFVYAPVQKIEVVDKYVVRFYLKYPFAPFLNNLAVPMAAPVVGPVAHDSADGNPVPPPGTGPYIPAGEIEGGILLRANPHYWASTPGVQEIAFLTVTDSLLQSEMLLHGQSDIALDLTFNDATRVRFQGYPVFRTTGLDICYLGFYTERAPFNSVEVRKAVARALDLNEVYKHLGLQQAQPATGHLPPGVMGSESNERPGYDQTTAAQLLNDAGHQKGLSFTLITYSDPRPYTPGGGKELAEALAKSAARTGITINVRAYPWNQFKEALQRREGDAFLYGWISDNGDPDNFLYTLLAPDQIEHGQNITHYRSTQLETILISGRNTTDMEIRRQLYAQAQEILNQDTPWVVLGHSLYHAATAPHINGFVLSPTGWHTLGDVKKNVAQ